MGDVTVGERTFDTDAIADAHITYGRRDVRPLVAGMSLVLLAMLVPTVGVALDIDFWTIAPVGLALLGCSPIAFFLWLRSSTQVLVVVADDDMHHFAVENVGEMRAAEVVAEFSR